ncbi:hypothetical protein GQ600_23013 [Phytophthora cactorum]|nr:hypothetical protein GQ600_23013 [Phytophthora cactorum]
MSAPKAEKTVHGVLELQPPPGQDANGITVSQWSSPVIPEEPEGFIASNVNMEACCPCIPLAQVEVRLGLTSYAGALSWYTAAYGLLALALAGLWIFVALWIYSQAYRDATSVLVRILWILASLALAAVPSLLLVRRIATLRSTVRERFDIPGSVREDRTAAWQETARAIRQMRRHLKIDQAKGGASPRCRPILKVMRRMDGVLPTAGRTKAATRDEQEAPGDRQTASRRPGRVPCRDCDSGQDDSRLQLRIGAKSQEERSLLAAQQVFFPGPGAYAVSKADRIVKVNAGGGGVLGLRSGACCRFQPCECKKPQEQVEIPAGDLDGMRQDTKQPRRASPSLVAASCEAAMDACGHEHDTQLSLDRAPNGNRRGAPHGEKYQSRRSRKLGDQSEAAEAASC